MQLQKKTEFKLPIFKNKKNKNKKVVTIDCLESEKNKDYSLEKLKKLSKKDLQTICVHEQLTHSGNKEKLLIMK